MRRSLNDPFGCLTHHFLLLSQDIITGLDKIMFADDVMEAIQWFFEIHSEGRDSLTKEEVLRLSESLLFCEFTFTDYREKVHRTNDHLSTVVSAVFRNEPEDGYLGAVSELIGQSFLHGGEGGGTEKAQG